MPEFLREEEEDEIYFGEDYYDENASDSEGEFDDNPYVEAERLAKKQAKHKRNK